MNKLSKWQLKLSLILILLSVILSVNHYLIFKDIHNLIFYLLIDIAFLPLQVLLVTIILNELLSGREKKVLLNKLNMVIGAFFSEIGTELLKRFIIFDNNHQMDLALSNLNNEDLSQVNKLIGNHNFQINSNCTELELLKIYLSEKRPFLLSLLGNQNLLEHELFTELLWTVFHLTEELSNRKEVNNLSSADYEHLSLDIKRAYVLLIKEWLAYMEHLKKQYPYLFSLALRTNPFDANATVEIK